MLGGRFCMKGEMVEIESLASRLGLQSSTSKGKMIRGEQNGKYRPDFARKKKSLKSGRPYYRVFGLQNRNAK